MKKHDREVMHSSEKSDWGTPRALFDRLSEKYGPFQVDVCATAVNAKCPVYFAPEEDALSVSSWSIISTRLWMNPPYGRNVTGKWVKKAYEESRKGALVCCLLPARTCTTWFHDTVLPAVERGEAKVEFLRGRVKFEGAKHGAPFPSMVVVFDGRKQ
jgi:phage N-6-adenine-methyltransferase